MVYTKSTKPRGKQDTPALSHSSRSRKKERRHLEFTSSSEEETSTEGENIASDKSLIRNYSSKTKKPSSRDRKSSRSASGERGKSTKRKLKKKVSTMRRYLPSKKRKSDLIHEHEVSKARKIHVRENTLLPLLQQTKVDVRVTPQTPWNRTFVGVLKNDGVRSPFPVQFLGVKVPILSTESQVR